MQRKPGSEFGLGGLLHTIPFFPEESEEMAPEGYWKRKQKSRKKRISLANKSQAHVSMCFLPIVFRLVENHNLFPSLQNKSSVISTKSQRLNVGRPTGPVGSLTRALDINILYTWTLHHIRSVKYRSLVFHLAQPCKTCSQQRNNEKIEEKLADI